MMTENEHLNTWIKEVQALCQPDSVQIIYGHDDGQDEDGQSEELAEIYAKLVTAGTLIPLNPKHRVNSYLARSNPDDVARVEDRTFICSSYQEDAGPTNNWKDPQEMRKILKELFSGCMKGRIMYVIPYCMGPFDSPYAKVSVQITDSAYVVVNMAIMTRIGKKALQVLGKNDFVKCLHSVGKSNNTVWPCDPTNTYISHFPENKEVCSYGSGYGGNALLSKKCFALRLASKMAKDEGWLAEHMLIIAVTNPEGHKRYFVGSFPSACGKTNLAMLRPSLAGWKVECVGDDIAWMHWGDDGRLYAINPESGFFGVAPGTSIKSNPVAMKTIEENCIFTNVALTDDGDVWWEKMTDMPPKHLISWKGIDWTPDSAENAAHPNSRFTVASKQCPILDSHWQDPKGVPISGIIFGSRRSSTVPLIRQALSWQHGVFLGASMSSETTAAASGKLGLLRHDPFAMLPFCGYNMADYFGHWLSMQKTGRSMPQIFYVNWFQKDQGGRFLWPGFGENIRVLKWCFERIENKVGAKETPLGYLPNKEDLDLSGLDLKDDAIKKLLNIDNDEWKKEGLELQSYFQQFGEKLPQALDEETKRLLDAFQ